MQPFSHRQFKTALLFARGLIAQDLTDGNTINTYNTSQGGASIDCWNSGRCWPSRMLLLIDVGSLSAGTLTISLRDDDAALTNANGDANSSLVCQLGAISAAGLYFAEINLAHVFPNTTDAQSYIRRYHSIRAVASGGDAKFSVGVIYSFFQGRTPSQTIDELAVSYNDPS